MVRNPEITAPASYTHHSCRAVRLINMRPWVLLLLLGAASRAQLYQDSGIDESDGDDLLFGEDEVPPPSAGGDSESSAGTDDGGVECVVTLHERCGHRLAAEMRGTGELDAALSRLVGGAAGGETLELEPSSEIPEAFVGFDDVDDF